MIDLQTLSMSLSLASVDSSSLCRMKTSDNIWAKFRIDEGQQMMFNEIMLLSSSLENTENFCLIGIKMFTKDLQLFSNQETKRPFSTDQIGGC